jgi:hypothetical protein
MWQDDDALAAAEDAQSAHGPADGRISRQSQPAVRIVTVAAVF